MKRQLLYATTAALLFAACSEPLQEAVEINPQIEPEICEAPITFSPEEYRLIEQMVNKTPKVSSEDAQQAAMSLFGQGGLATLSPGRLTAKVFCNQKTIPGGLNKSAKIENDTAFYLFNAPDGNGFAIISADVRVPQQVLAYSDNGSFDDNEDNQATELFLDLAKEYVAECIETAEMQKDSLTESIYNKLGISEDTKGLHTKRYQQKILLTNLCQKNQVLKTTAEVKPMLKTNWTQHDPFNNDCEGNLAGCVAIATAQLMTYWHFPQKINNRTINWNLIDVDNIDNNNKEYCQQVASLVRAVGVSVYTKYGKTKSSANSLNALGYLGTCNYSQPYFFYPYKYEMVTSSLNNGCPVFMRGYEGKGKNGHAWLVDGYVEQNLHISSTLTYIVIDVDDNNHVETHYEYGSEEKSNNYKYLHINWGWGKSRNGYYLKDVFYAKNRYTKNADGTYGIDYTDQEYNFHYNLEIAPDIRPKR